MAASTHVDAAALTVQSPDDIGSADGLATAHLGDGAGVLFKARGKSQQKYLRCHLRHYLSTYVQQPSEEAVELAAYLSINIGRDTLDTSTAGETANVGFGDALDIVLQDLPVIVSALANHRWLHATIMKCCSPVALRTADLAQAEAFTADTTSEVSANGSLAAVRLSTCGATKRHGCCVLLVVCFGAGMF
jgi:hypothetical protein